MIEVSPVEGVTFRYIETNGIRMRIAEMGDEGPLVLLAHGWPESWYSWRHQIPVLANAGYRVVVPEMRGYGKTDAPDSVEDYDIVHLAADMVGVLDALGEEKATIVGHDWGALVASNSVLLHPDRFSSLVLMSVPHRPRGATSPMAAMKARTGDNFFYIMYHNEPGGVAEAEYDDNPRGLLSRLYLSPGSPREAPEVTDPKRSAGGWIPRLGAAVGLPDWLTQADLDYYVAQFESTGFRGGVNYYRNFQRNWEITEHLADAKITVPTLFIAGEKDVVIGGATAPMLTSMMAGVVDDLRDVVLVPEIGHWIQQEDPVATNEALLKFLKSLE
ncbi:MAG: alpha/beta hydrolase [Gammaproteobacteria bacterium]|nr:alpha/beta hydrolase [Gammaproteobacteria bacterium]